MACPVPTAISNGYYVRAKVSYTAGDVIQYVCNTDYVMSGSPMSVCDATGNWVPASGSLPQCSTSYFTNIWFLLVITLMGFIAFVIIIVLMVICCRICCKKRVYDEESETEGGVCCRPRCACCTCCSGDDEDEDEKPRYPARRKPLTTARKAPAKKATTKKTATAKKTAGKDKTAKRKVVSKKGNFLKSKGKKGGKTLKKGKGKPKGKGKKAPTKSEEPKKVTVWKPFAGNSLNVLDTSTKITKRVPL